MVSTSHIKESTEAVVEAIKEAVKLAKKNEKNFNDFILIIADATYEKYLEGNINGLSPYSINDCEAQYRDIHRKEFYVTYINENAALRYDEVPEKNRNLYFRFNTTIEFMIYAHIWESTWFLKSLKQLANLIDGKSFDWHIGDKISGTGRSNIIKDHIIKVFEKHELKLASIIQNSYSSQIRNAFAHSDFNFGYINEKDTIRFFNKTSKESFDKISYEAWHERFSATICLSHYINVIFDEERKKCGNNSFIIAFPDYNDNNKLKPLEIKHYNEPHEHFNFY